MMWNNCIEILNFISQLSNLKPRDSKRGKKEGEGKGEFGMGNGEGKGEFGMGNGEFKGVGTVADSTGYPVSFTKKIYSYLSAYREGGKL
jgi:hypothetical protein